VAFNQKPARGKPGPSAAPGRRRLLTGAAAGLAIGAGVVAAGAVVAPRAAAAAAGGSLVTIPPSGDVKGATDATAINRALSAGQAVQLVPGSYYVNATIEVPAHGVLRGAGRDALGSPYVTTIQAVGALDAVIASAGWVQNTNADGLNGSDLSYFTVNGNNTAVNGIVLQTFDGRVDNVAVMKTTYSGIAWSTLSSNQQKPVSGNLSNNRVTNCVIENCAGPGIATFESPASDTYTDGYCLFNIVTGCGTGIFIQQSADWLVLGNHVYTVQTHGVVLGDMWNTKVVGNQIDQWGQSASKSVYRAIDGLQYPSWGGMNVVTGNVIDVQVAPGNHLSGLEGMNLACHANSTATWTVTGNNLFCEPTASQFHYADPLVVTNAASTCVTDLASTANQAAGNWSTKSWVTVAQGGTIKHTTGV
jgi:Periplasmic copper-binding protein (NosD)